MIRLPNLSHRLIIVGKNGTGKTQAGLWHLSRADKSVPWLIIDYKRDKSIAAIGAIECDLHKLPDFVPGEIYVIHPMPNDPQIESVLWQLWQRENIGIFIDESYMLPNCDAINAILTQGRSKHVPVIALTQRPVFVPRFFFSEADFFQTFWLNDARDRKTIASFQPEETRYRLPQYHSYYYDVGEDALTTFGPVPMEMPTRVEAPPDRVAPLTGLRTL